MSNKVYNEFEWAEKELPIIKEFFEKISNNLNQFAKDHNLRIEKYYHDIPGWEFLFRHPEGGQCYIEILKSDETHVTLMAAMWINEFDSDIAYDKHTNRILCSIDGKELINKLNEILNKVLSWKKRDMEKFQSKKTTMTKEELEKDLERYPNPRF